jgi:hypothetical protein
MSTIHEMSNVTPHPDFDLFSVPPTQLTIERDIQSEHRPISTLDSSSVIQFVITTTPDEYIQLRDTLLKIKLKINIKKAVSTTTLVADDWKKIAPANYLLHSLFNNVQVEIDNKSISISPQTYAYKAYFDMLLGYTNDAKNSYLTAAGYYDDKDSKTAFTEAESKLITPGTFVDTGEGKSIELMGKLHIDLFSQPRALLGGVTLKITLVPNKPVFYLICKDATIVPSVVFEDVTLFMHRSKVIYPVVNAHSAALEKGTAKYPISRGTVKAFNITTGNTDIIIDNAVYGILPRRIFIALVPNDAYSGAQLKNPFDFKTYKLSYLAVHIDGQQYPMKAYTPDFINNIFTREYLGLFESLNQLTTDSTISLTQNQWANGNTIYGFNFAPDLSDDCCKMGFASVIKKGALKVELKFAEALKETISVLMYCEYDSIIEIDGNRQVYSDYI